MVHPYRPNTFYGFEKILQIYAKWGRPIKAIIPHGVLINPYLVPTELRDWPLPTFLGYSWLTDEVARACRKESEHSASPFVYFVDCVEPVAPELRFPPGNDRLLFFPSHSSGLRAADPSSASTIERLQRLRSEGFDCTVCVYWRDVELGKDKIFLDMGFPVVSCGHRDYLSFSRTLVRIILEHDVIAGDSLGSHMFYGSYLGRPYFSVEEFGPDSRTSDGVLTEFLDDRGLSQLRFREVLRGRTREYFRGMCNAFGTTTPGGEVEHQKSLTNEFLGVNNILDRDSLRTILRRSEQLDLFHRGHRDGAPVSPLTSRALRNVVSVTRRAAAALRSSTDE